MNADGSDQNRLTSSGTTDRDPNRITSNISGDSARDPAWSSDGAKIAFTTTRDGNPEIYVMNADGSDQTRLTNTLADDIWPAWSPFLDGN
jgi:Tol biopolymer transport system component